MGICCELPKTAPAYKIFRYFFFELDNPFNQEHYNRVCECYRFNRCDFLVHRTGNGLHFLSPTLVSVECWKEMKAALKGINPRSMQTTMRWKANKYVGEKEIWFTSSCGYHNDGSWDNSAELVHLLNKFWNPDIPFKGEYEAGVRFVPYLIKYETR